MKKIKLFLIAVICLFVISCNKEESILDQPKEETTSVKMKTSGTWTLYPTWEYTATGGVPKVKCFAKGSQMIVSVWNYNTSYGIVVKLNYTTSLCANPVNFAYFNVPANQNVSYTILSWGSSSPNLQVEIRPSTTGTFTGIVTVSAKN